MTSISPPATPATRVRERGRQIVNLLIDRGGAVAWAILVVGLLFTGALVRYEKHKVDDNAQRAFNRISRDVRSRIEIRLHEHARVLRSGAAFFADSDGVSRSEWRAFIERLHFTEELPGIQGMGFAQLLAPAQLEKHIANVRAEGFPDYRVWPEGERELYSSIVFLEPFSGRNLRAFGYDMLSEPARREAMERARDEDTAAITAPVTLVQENGKKVQVGTLMYVPVYRTGWAHETVADRRAALRGWVYSPFRMDDLMHGILGGRGAFDFRGIHLKVFDGAEEAAGRQLFASAGAPEKIGDYAAQLSGSFTLDVGGRHWFVWLADRGEIIAAADYSKVWLWLGGGTATSLLLFGLVLSLANTRVNARRLAEQLAADLKSSDERWQFALEGSGDGMWDWDVESGRVFYSDQLQRMLGYEPGEFGPTLKEWADRVHPNDLAATMADVNAHFDGKTRSYVNEHRIRAKDGSYRWILDRGMVVRRDAAGRPLRVVGTHKDIAVRKRGEAALRESEHFSRAILDAVSAHLCVLDETGKIVAVNQAWRDFSTANQSGSCTAVCGEVNANYLTVCDHAQGPSSEQGRAMAAGIRNVMKGECAEFSLEYPCHSPQAQRWFFARVSRFRGTSGYVVVSHEDITTRTLAAAAVRESDIRQRAMLTNLSDVIAVVDRRGGGRYASPNLVKCFGWTLEELAKTTCWALIHPADRPRLRRNFAELMTKPHSTSTNECRCRCKDGRYLWVEFSAVNLLEDPAIEGVLLSLHDISARRRAQLETAAAQVEQGRLLAETERARVEIMKVAQDYQRSEEALRVSEARFRELFDEAPIGYHEIDRAGRMVAVNQTELALLGYAREDMVGRLVSDFAVDPARSEAAVRAKLAGLEPIAGSQERQVRRKDGSILDVLITDTLIRDRTGAIVGIRTSIGDNTEQKLAAEKLRGAMREQEALLKEVHHRVKNNLQVIASLLRLESARAAEPSARGVLKEMQGRIRAMALLHESLYRSRNLAQVDLAAYLRQVASQLFRAHNDRPDLIHLQLDLVNVAVEIDQAIPCGLVVNELLMNCLKHAFPSGRGGEVRIRLATGDEGRVSLAVSDTGVGLSAEAQAHAQTTLGLQLVDDLTRQLGGFLETRSSVGAGSTFTLSFQLACASPAAAPTSNL